MRTALVYHIPPDADMEDTTAARDWRHGAAAKDRRIGRWTVNACPLIESLDTPGHLLPSMAVELPTSIRLRLALVGADEGAAGQLPALQGAAQGPRPTALRSAQRRRGGIDSEEVPVRAVTDRRHGAAVALLAEVVAASTAAAGCSPSASPVAVG